MQTKFDIGQEVFTIYDNRVVKAKIKEISILKNLSEYYVIEFEKKIDESMGTEIKSDFVFSTKEELLKNL